jgi:hypothetical protein
VLRSIVSAFLVCVCAFGQSNFATVSGRVEDSSHAPVEGARITIRAKDTGAVRLLESKGYGLFEAVNLLPGDYSVDVEATGFAAVSRQIRLEVGQNMGLDLILSVGGQHETLAVTAAADTLKTRDSSLGEVVEPKSIQDLPLNGRMLLDLVLTVPGAHAGHGAQTGTTNPLYWRPGQASAVTIGGNRPNANYFLLDGVTNTDPAFNTQNFSPSPDAVQEFQVQTGSYRAEMGSLACDTTLLLRAPDRVAMGASMTEYEFPQSKDVSRLFALRAGRRSRHSESNRVPSIAPCTGRCSGPYFLDKKRVLP